MSACRSVLASHDAERLAEAFRAFNLVSGELSGAYASLQDRVERLTAELAAANGELRRQYHEKAALGERLAALLDALPAGVVVLDRDGGVELCNRAACELLGKDASGASWPEARARCLAPAGLPGEWRTVGGGRLVAASERPLDSGGRIVLLHDITEAHELKAQAQRNEHLAAMGELLASAAHQLRTPLAAALLFAGNLERAGLDEAERRRCASGTVERLRVLDGLIRNVLGFARGGIAPHSRIEAGRLALDAAALIEPLARERGIAFVAARPARTACVSGDRKALTGALVNLIENALQAAGRGGEVALDVRVDAGAVRFVVRDNGRGIDPAVRSRLFEPFFSTRADGTGLGLAIVRGVARAHGGSIDFSGAPGGGAQFVLTLPLLGETLPPDAGGMQ